MVTVVYLWVIMAHGMSLSLEKNMRRSKFYLYTDSKAKMYFGSLEDNITSS